MFTSYLPIEQISLFRLISVDLHINIGAYRLGASHVTLCRVPYCEGYAKYLLKKLGRSIYLDTEALPQFRDLSDLDILVSIFDCILEISIPRTIT